MVSVEEPCGKCSTVARMPRTARPSMTPGRFVAPVCGTWESDAANRPGPEEPGPE